MTTALEVIKRPAPTADYTRPSGYRRAGIGIGLLGLAAAGVVLVTNIVAATGADRGPSGG